MSTIAIISQNDNEGAPFLALSGSRQSVGKTMGEALDALASQLESIGSETLVLIQKREPDQYFTAEQHERLRELMDRRASLSADERAELEDLIDTEIDATVARTDAVVERLRA